MTMNILMDIAHPAHVHLLRNTYFELIKRGHKVHVTVKDIPSAISLLKKYDIPFIYLGGMHDSLMGKVFLQFSYNYKLLKLVRKNKIELGFGSSLTLAHISRITKMHSIILDDDDDEVEPLFVKYAHPYADVVLSPDCTNRATKNLLSYAGYHELAYLHPHWFTPDPSVLQEIGLKEGEPYFVLRFNAFKAHHDVGVEGLSIENKRKLIDSLAKKGRVFITTERNIDDEFKQYQLLLSPEKIHSLIYYATMLIGDSQTMTSEAAVLGTPAVKCNSFAGRLSVPNELESNYQLCFSFLPENSHDFFLKIEELLSEPNIKATFSMRKEKLLADKIDVTAFFCWFIENYPESARIMKENPDYQLQFN
jgi:predicted glycosyltransferase